MSETLANLEHSFNNGVTSAQVLAALKQEGAILLRDFIPPHEQAQIVEEVLAHELEDVDKSGHTIPEQFQATEWTFHRSPQYAKKLGQSISKLVRPAIPEWFTNHVRAQLYSPGEVGIELHRDYTCDLRVIAVASFIGSSLFEAKLDSGEIAWELQPGDLTLMRGTLLNGNLDDRPQHRVSAPINSQRLSLAYRQVAAQKPNLEKKHV